MKKIKRIALFLFVGIIAASLFSSCDEDDPKVLPESAFTFSPTTIVEWDVVTFTNTTTEGETYVWDFGDGTATSIEMSPTHVFTEAGSYTVALTATNGDGENIVTETVVVAAHNNVYVMDGTEYAITEALEVANTMGGANYWRMFAEPATDTTKTLLKFYPNLGTGSLEGTYTFDDADDGAVDTFTYGMTENWDGYMGWDFVDQGLTGATLTFTELATDIWKITLANGTLAQGDYVSWVWTANGTELTYSVDYIGAITPPTI